MSLDITISDELADYVNQQARAGGFKSADSFVENCLKAFQTHPLTTDAAEESILRGCEQAKADEFYEGSIDQIRQNARAKWKGSSSK